MNFQHTDKDGATLRVNAADSVGYGRQVYVQLAATEGYVPPEKAADAAAGFLEAAGVEVDDVHELTWNTSPEGHEAFALAHLLAARQVRRQEAERKARHALADAVRKEFPETDPYDGIKWDDMTHKGRHLHLNRLGRLLKVLNAQDGIDIPDPWADTDKTETEDQK